MLHQRLISPCFSFPPSFSSPSSPVPVRYSYSSQIEMETQPQHEGLHEDEEFVVDDLLDFGGLTETEKQEEVIDDNNVKDDAHNSNSSVFSPVSFYPSPLSELVPTHDATELEWVSRIMDDSLSEFPACNVAVPALKPAKKIMSNGRLQAVKTKATKAKRSKWSGTRSPSASWYCWGSPDSSCSSSATTTATTASSSCSSSSYSSPLIFSPFLHPPKILKKRGRKPKVSGPSHPEAVSGEFTRTATAVAATAAAATERRCSHCGVSKTPQWRAGPAGAKTLCNACGVRYKSGRLLPEYRPACSPTFVSHVHSNSHRKVLEMRRKKEAVEEDDDSLVLVYSAPAVASF